MVAPESAKPLVGPSFLDGLDIPFRAEVPLGPMTWYGVGGPADLYAQPHDVESLAELVHRCHESEVPLHVLGSGANLLIAESGVRGVVVKLDAPTFTGIDRSNHSIYAGAGADLPKLIMQCAKDGLAGLEGLAGIPASIGGAIRMNCGGKYGQIGDRVASVLCLSESGDLVAHPAGDIEFGYRSTSLDEPLVLQATFALDEDDPAALRDRVKEIFAWKKSTQPLAEHSAGCAFKNPVDQSDKGAGQLIDEAGLKGFSVGLAEVSQRHANFLVMRPGGTSTDLIRLLRAVKQRVAEQTGITLTEEVVIWGHTPVDP